MNLHSHRIEIAALACLAVVLPARAAVAIAPSPAPQDQPALPQMFSMDWSAGTPMPQGMQDNHVVLMGHWLVSALGFCGGADDDWKPGKYPRGFLNKAWGLDLNNEAAGWVALPDFPGAPRQAGEGAVVDGALYLWGGFSYDKPYTYTDGYRLTHENGIWTWTPLPPLPSPACWSGTVSIGTNIYALGGADYDAQRFYCPEDQYLRQGNVLALRRRGEHYRCPGQHRLHVPRRNGRLRLEG